MRWVFALTFRTPQKRFIILIEVGHEKTRQVFAKV
jgi:hypothetical protein